jgi:hypothetical protein
VGGTRPAAGDGLHALGAGGGRRRQAGSVVGAFNKRKCIP